MADQAAGSPTPRAAAGDRLRLQTTFGIALMASRGFQAAETKAAFARARELAGQANDPLERFAVYYGLWSGNYIRGELAAMREIAETMLGEAERLRPGRFVSRIVFME
jgi:hypothetical protein